MKKRFRTLFLCLMIFASVVSAETLTAGKAYIVSSINVNASQTIQSGQSYSLVPQVIVATGNENYVGSVSTFTGCFNGKRYEAGVEKGNCLTSVINNLTSTSTTDALSAAQGKILNDKIADTYTKSEVDAKIANSGVNASVVVTLGDNQEIGSVKEFSNHVRSTGPGLSIENGLPKIWGSQQTGSIWDSNGISFSNPGTLNDAGWIRVTGSGENDTFLEIGTGDDGANDFNIAFRGYNTSNNVVYDVRIPKTSGTLVTDSNLVNYIYPVGSVYFSVTGANPATLFGGTWALIGTKLAVNENVIGNGKALALTDSRRTGGLVMHHNPSRTAISPKAFGQQQYTWADDIAGEDRRAYGVPTKAQLGSDLSNSGLIVDTVTIYSWQRTA